MIRLPGGPFLMGSPEDEPGRGSDEDPQHWVTIGPFAIGRTEVPFTDYDRFVAATGREKPDDRGWGRGDQPAIDVSWHDAMAYAEWLSDQTGQPYRLPIEAEWEYAARGEEGRRYPWGNEPPDPERANYDRAAVRARSTPKRHFVIVVVIMADSDNST